MTSKSRLPQEGGFVRGQHIREPFIATVVWGVVLLAVWIIAGLFLYVNPIEERPERSDAIVVLAPNIPTGRLDYAENLMSQGYGSTLVVSVPDDTSGKTPSDICDANRTYRIICFSPDPVTTQGEARAIQRLSGEHAWRTITVVTNDFHVTRARTIIERCYSHKLNMAAVRNDHSLTDWSYRFVYESAAFVKATVHRDC